MANVLWVNDSNVETQHQANIAASLAHRLEVARATRNTQLVVLLEQEQRQLQAQSRPSRLSNLFSSLNQRWHNLILAIENSSKLSVERVVDEAGSIWWYAHDPATGKTLYAETEADVLQWIEDNRLGQ